MINEYGQRALQMPSVQDYEPIQAFCAGGPDEALRDPHTLARGMVVEVEHPKAGKMKTLGIPAKMSETPGRIRFPSPTLGQHTEDVLKGMLALSDRDIEQLRANNVVL